MRKQITEDRIPDYRPGTKPGLNGSKPEGRKYPGEVPTIRQRFQTRYDTDAYFRAMIDMAAIMAMALTALFFFYTVLTW